MSTFWDTRYIHQIYNIFLLRTNLIIILQSFDISDIFEKNMLVIRLIVLGTQTSNAPDNSSEIFFITKLPYQAYLVMKIYFDQCYFELTRRNGCTQFEVKYIHTHKQQKGIKHIVRHFIRIWGFQLIQDGILPHHFYKAQLRICPKYFLS